MKAVCCAFARLAFVASLALAAGCSEENRLERVDFSYDSAPPAQATVSSSAVSIRVGQAIAVHAYAVMSEDPLESEDRFELRSRDESILGLDEREGPSLFVLYGVTPGETEVQAFVNGRPGPVIVARVLDAP
jgi:hypothetical protein